ncbi:MAG: acetyl-coenzyme A synthetase N-terminal domain-containing protein, partial [Steroidobacteraceae bacterium]
MSNETVAVAPPQASINPYSSRIAWEVARAACERDPGAFHGDIACRELHWFEPTLGSAGAWIRYDDTESCWIGFDAASGAQIKPNLAATHRPWHTALDTSEAPFYRWFDGALTNACFNEIDRHVLDGHGDEAALWFDGDRWDQSQADGRGAPVVSYSVSRK